MNPKNILFSLLFLFISVLHAQPTGSNLLIEQYFTSPNLTSFIVPLRVYSLTILLIGGGGGGGISSELVGGGGGGGGTVRATVLVTPNLTCDIQVGQGGAAINSTNSTLGENGANSTFNCSNGTSNIIFLQANGGEGGNVDVFFTNAAGGGNGIVEGSAILHSLITQGQNAAGVVGGGSTEGEGASLSGSWIIRGNSGGEYGGGGLGGISIFVSGESFPSTAGGNGLIVVSYVLNV